MKVFDPETDQTKRITAEPLRGFGSGGFITWSPVRNRGMIGTIIAPCMSIAWLTPQGVELAAITVSEGDRSWRLDEDFKRGGSDCDDLGNAGWPAWSPDGQTIAFFASPQAMTAGGGFSRFDAPWNLYLMDPVEQMPRKVLAGLTDAYAPAWSADNQWLAFPGEVKGRRGTWAYGVSSGQLIRVSKDEMADPSWSPDGRQLAGLVDVPDRNSLDYELVILDVGSVLSMG